ncbi:MAG: hypothetical protein GYB33_08655 [Gammaproteobacteria bacterium]|nr:hypothetical protein [Gammaproteobacteria bacterium]
MAKHSQEALNELLDSLRTRNARDVADQITRVVARGITEEIDIKGKIIERSQRPLNPDEAYAVAVEILIASLEPMIMKRHALDELEETMGSQCSIIWAQDFVEKSPVALVSYEEIDIPDSQEVGQLEEKLKILVKMIGEV